MSLLASLSKVISLFLFEDHFFGVECYVKVFRRPEYASIFEQWECHGKSKPTNQTLEQADSPHCPVNRAGQCSGGRMEN